MRRVLAIAAFAALLLVPTLAQAQYPWGGYYGSAYYGRTYGLGVSAPRTFVSPPYFSLYPPVYYSHEIVRRPMGMGPLAYTGLGSQFSAPVSAPAAAPAPVVQADPKPLMIVNPFVKQKKVAAVKKAQAQPAEVKKAE